MYILHRHVHTSNLVLIFFSSFTFRSASASSFSLTPHKLGTLDWQRLWQLTPHSNGEQETSQPLYHQGSYHNHCMVWVNFLSIVSCHLNHWRCIHWMDYLKYHHTKCFLVTWGYIVTEFVGLNNSPSCQKSYCESLSLQYMDSKLCGMEFPMYYSLPTDETWVTCTQLPIIRTHIYTHTYTIAIVPTFTPHPLFK